MEHKAELIGMSMPHFRPATLRAPHRVVAPMIADVHCQSRRDDFATPCRIPASPRRSRSAFRYEVEAQDADAAAPLLYHYCRFIEVFHYYFAGGQFREGALIMSPPRLLNSRRRRLQLASKAADDSQHDAPYIATEPYVITRDASVSMISATARYA